MNEQPIAWLTLFNDPNRGSYNKPADTHLTRESADAQVQRHESRGLCALRVEPLYTRHQPAAPCEYIQYGKDGTHWCALAEKPAAWVELPDMEVFDLADTHLYGGKNYGILSFYRAIEAKLKEKNT